MSVILELNPKYPHFETPLRQIKTVFEASERSIHKARNELKIIDIEGVKCVVKAFKIPNFINRFAYAYVRKSKAYKSFHNAMKLESRLVNTPEAIGFVEFYEQGLLKESFFIAKYEPYDLSMATVRDEELEDKSSILEAFACFSYELHVKGVWHMDYSGGNVLITRTDKGYHFCLVDINRMKFRTVTKYEGLGNFNKFWLGEEDLEAIGTTYAKCAKLDEERTVAIIVEEDRKLKEHVLRRRAIKAFFKGMK